MSLSGDELRSALATIAAWRQDPESRVACPHCGHIGLSLADRSARPYVEWYQLACAHCGLDETIHIPLGPPVIGGLD